MAAPARDPPIQRKSLLDVVQQYGGVEKVRRIAAARRSAGILSAVSRLKAAGCATSSRLRHAALKAQVAILNRTRAAKSDDLLPETSLIGPRSVRSDAVVKGKGAYKKPTVEQVQRDVFAAPHRTMSDIAGDGRSSRYITDWSLASAFTLLRLQEEAVSFFLCDKVAAVVQFIFDESKHSVLYRGRMGRATQTSTRGPRASLGFEWDFIGDGRGACVEASRDRIELRVVYLRWVGAHATRLHLRVAAWRAFPA